MKWTEELKLYLSWSLPADKRELKRLLVELKLSRYSVDETRFSSPRLNTYQAQKRIRKALNARWRVRLAIGAIILGALGFFVHRFGI